METCKIDKKIVGWKVNKVNETDVNSAKDVTDIVDRPKSFKKSLAPRRPKTLVCDIKKANIKGESWTFLIGLFDGKPYEVFGGLSKFIEIPTKHKSGELVKNGKVDGLTTYKLYLGEGDDQIVINDVANVFENANYGAFTRMISLAMRHGTPVQYIVEQLQKDKFSDITSFSRVMARVLKGYIVEEEKVEESSKPKCVNCGSSNVVFVDGCSSCRDCLYSKCS